MQGRATATHTCIHVDLSGVGCTRPSGPSMKSDTGDTGGKITRPKLDPAESSMIKDAIFIAPDLQTAKAISLLKIEALTPRLSLGRLHSVVLLIWTTLCHRRNSINATDVHKKHEPCNGIQ